MEHNVKRERVIGGISWHGALAILEKITRFLTGIIVARILGPEPFGIFAFGILALSLPSDLLRSPIGEAIINRQEERESSYHLAWTVKLYRLLVAVIVFFLAPFIADFFGQAEVLNVTRWLVLGYILATLESPYFLRAQRKLKFKRIAIYAHIILFGEVFFQLIGAVVFRNEYALVTGYLINGFLTFLLSYLIFPVRPRIYFNFREFVELLGFGKWVWLDRVAGSISNNSVNAIIGKLLDTASVGLYSKTHSLAVTPLKLIKRALSPVLFPTFSAMHRDKDRMSRYIQNLVAAYIVIGVVVAGVMFNLTEDIVILLLGDEWAGIIPMIKAFLPVFLFYGTLTIFSPAAFKGYGLPKISTSIKIANAFFMIAFTYLGIRLYGSVGIVYGLSLALTLDTLLMVIFLHRLRIVNIGFFVKVYGISSIVLAISLIMTPLGLDLLQLQYEASITGSILRLFAVLVFYFMVALVLTLIGPFKEIRDQFVRYSKSQLSLKV